MEKILKMPLHLILALTTDYVDLNYHTETSAITGIVYKNIESESELNNPQVLQSRKTVI
ncbi:hypothetical protein [Mycoplasmopsis cynos]|uniref:hypothetical protein n=1 Tax=Mycoplasmopsis cynos TaxID=171284 RepID=UPI002541CF87|nr:hypothetical protein [Mycoplasmopsis cynos]MCU9934822.1 hypothetical protein [Mycoplasmopsis cynos]